MVFLMPPYHAANWPQAPGPPLRRPCPHPRSPHLHSAPIRPDPRLCQLLRVVTGTVSTPTFLAACLLCNGPLSFPGGLQTPQNLARIADPLPGKHTTAQNFTPSFRSFITDPGSSGPSWEQSMGLRLSPDQGRRRPPRLTGGETEAQKGWRREGCPKGRSKPGGLRLGLRQLQSRGKGW